MKVAVVGGGVDVHPRTGRRLRPAARRAAGRRAGPGRPGRRRARASSPHVPADAGPRRPPGPVVAHDRRRRRASTAPTRCCSSCGSAARPPGSRTRRGRWSAAASARRPPAPAAWPRRCAPCRSCSTSPRRCRSRPPGRLDRRLHQPGRHRHPGAAGRRAPRGRAVQRGDRVPALVRRAARGRAGRGRARPRRAQPPDLGAGGAPWTARDVLPRAARASTRREHRRARSSCRPWLVRQLGRGALLLPALLLRPRRGGRRAARRRRRARPQVARDGGASCWSCTPTRRWTPSPTLLASAAARSTPRPRSTCSPRCTADRRRRPGGEPAQRRHACRSCPTTRSIEVPADDHRGRRRGRCPVDPVPPDLLGADRARLRVRAARPGRGRARRPRPGLRGAAGAPAGGPVRPGRAADRPAARRQPRRTCRWAPVTAAGPRRHRRRQQQDRGRARRPPPGECWPGPRAGLLPPSTSGAEGAVPPLDDAGREGRALGRPGGRAVRWPTGPRSTWPASTSRPRRSRSTAAVAGAGLGPRARRGQRQLRPAARRHRRRRRGRGGLRCRHQLRRRAPRRPARPLRLARAHLRRLGRRPGTRRRGALVGGPRRRRPRARTRC